MRATRCLVLLSLLPLASCWTTLTVSRVDPEKRESVQGIRYSLPKPVLRVTPQADGTIEVEVAYLPDASRTYAIESSSWWAKHKLDVEVADGLLKKVVWNGDSSAVASQLAESAGSVGSAVVEARAAERKARRDAAAARSKQQEDDVEEARQAVAEAQTKLAVATTRLELIRAGYPAGSEKVVEAELAVATAQVELEAAERRLAGLLAQLDATASEEEALRKDGSQRGVPGPVFYEIRNEGDSVRLVGIQQEGDPQPRYATTVVGTAPTPAPVRKFELSSVSGAYPVLPLYEPRRDATRALRKAKAVLRALVRGNVVGTAEQIGKASADVAIAELAYEQSQLLLLDFRCSRPLERIVKARVEHEHGLSVPVFVEARSSTLFSLLLDDSFPDGNCTLFVEVAGASSELKLEFAVARFP